MGEKNIIIDYDWGFKNTENCDCDTADNSFWIRLRQDPQNVTLKLISISDMIE